MNSFLTLTASFFLFTSAWAVPDNSLYQKKGPGIFEKNEKTYRTCSSSKEFQKSFEYLFTKSELGLTESQSVEKALVIAKGCDGASDRFSSLFELLKKSGVDLGKSFEVAYAFSQMEDDRAQGFKEIFKKAFLENHLNLDFATAYRLTLEISKEAKGDPQNLRKDFVGFADFCTSEKSMALSLKDCTQLILVMLKATPMYSQGVFPSFLSLYRYLRENKRMGLSIRDALEVVPKVLLQGPQAGEEFRRSMDYTLEQGPLRLNEAQSLKLAQILAQTSFREATAEEMAQGVNLSQSRSGENSNSKSGSEKESSKKSNEKKK